ncbi:MAG: heme exporter protein CcmB [Proteobacteria bacterium]|nr:heme exporter protein CcmB [Pseudomonadota bacterium]
MSVFFIILRHELKINFRQLSRILASFLFFLIFLSSFSLLSQGQDSLIIILFSLLSCLIFSSAEFLKKDFESGASEQILISCENFESFIAAKMLANWVVCCVPILVVSSFIRPDLATLIIFVSLLVNFICCFCGTLSILGNAAPMIAALALPLIIPILLIALGDAVVSLKLLVGLCFFLTPILIFATTKIVKIAHE